jgi:molybdopterin/thiamine biosynthesis adenylyltransferase
VGRITVVDHDQVDLTNLQRQIAHTTERVGQDKATSAATAMRALNPDVQVHAITERANADLLDALVAGSQVVIDCCDNFETRHAVNAACVRHRVPLVSGAVIRFDGQATVFDARAATSPCYACVFPPDQPPPEVACATMGVLAPLVGLIGSLQASEALKLIMGVGSPLVGRLQMLDGRHMAWSELRLQRQADCPVCGSIAH